MAYQPTFSDIEEIEGREKYKPRLEDLNKIDHKKTLQDIIFQGLRPQKPAEIPGELSHLGRGMLAGLLKTGQGIGELEAKGLRALGVPIKPLQETRGSDESLGIPQIYSPQVADTPEGKTGFFIGQMAPYLGFPMSSARKASEKIVPWLLKEMGLQSGLVGASSAISQPDKPFLQAESETIKDPLAWASVFAGPALMGAQSGLKKIKNVWDMKGGTANPEEVSRRIEAAGDTPVPLGELIDSPALKGFQSSVLSYSPFSGMPTTYQKSGKSIDNRLNRILSKMNKSPSENLGRKIQEILQNTYLSARDKNQKLHDLFAESADKLGVKVNLDDYKKTAKSTLNEILNAERANPELSAIKNKSHEQIKELMRNISEGVPAKISDRMPLNEKDFKNASLLRARMNDLIDHAEKEGNSYHIGILSRLKKSLENDIESSAKNSGHPHIYDQYLEAKKDFANNVAPFERGELWKYAKPTSNADPDALLQTFIRIGQYERPELLEKMTRNLDKDTISQMAHDYLTKGSRNILGKDEVTNEGILTAYGKLGNRVKNILFNPSEKEELDKILLTRKILGKDVNQMISNTTGEKTAKHMGYGALMTALSAIIAGHPSVALGIGGAAAAGNMLKRKLMSDSWREKYIQAALKQKTEKPNKISRLPALSYPAYLNSQQEGG